MTRLVTAYATMLCIAAAFLRPTDGSERRAEELRALRLSGPAELKVIEGEPVLLTLVFHNVGATPVTWPVPLPGVKTKAGQIVMEGGPMIEDNTLMTLAELDRDGRIVRTLELTDRLGPAWQSRKLILPPGGSATRTINLRAYVPVILPGRYRIFFLVLLHPKVPLRHAMDLIVVRDEAKLAARLALLRKEFLGGYHMDDDLRLYDPRYTASIFMEDVEHCARFEGADPIDVSIRLGPVLRALCNGWVKEPEAMVKRIAAIINDPGVPEPVRQRLRRQAGMFPLKVQTAGLEPVIEKELGFKPPVNDGMPVDESVRWPPREETSTEAQTPPEPTPQEKRRSSRWRLMLPALCALAGLVVGCLVGLAIGRRSCGSPGSLMVSRNE